jgi:hypothetical protein
MSTINNNNNNNNNKKKIQPTQGGNDDSPREGSSFELADLMAILSSIHQSQDDKVLISNSQFLRRQSLDFQLSSFQDDRVLISNSPAYKTTES